MTPAKTPEALRKEAAFRFGEAARMSRYAAEYTAKAKRLLAEADELSRTLGAEGPS